MICFPNCKINLGLYVTAKRADGYHDIETVFYPVSLVRPMQATVPLHDVLEVMPAMKTSLRCSGIPVVGDVQSNLVMKAFSLLQQQFPERVKETDIFLHKNIPMGAGMGGGSADGAFLLMAVNELYKLGLTKTEFAALALQLGSDCPFFVYNTPQFARGRGEQMESVSLGLSGFGLQIICPKIHVSTAGAFSLIKPQKAGYDLRGLASLPVEQWRHTIANDFEAPIFSRHPALADIKQQLYAQGALYAAMSGSGSAIFGIFPKGAKATVKADTPFDSFYIE